jgi:hypothetical protein
MIAVIVNTQLQVTACNRGPFNKLTVTKLVNKFRVFYGTRMFITVFMRARHWTVS